ncbi:MAG TPA: trypsin-like peptidase domain-containing protein [Hyphomicrobiales bacterium]|nr:trypsin-like peptidase domain-containing protein [Hyphomicrobiales bacterium]
MKQLLNYILWPSLAGLVLALALLLATRLVHHVPALQALVPAPASTPEPLQAAGGSSLSFSAPIRRAAPAVVSINSKYAMEQAVLRLIQPPRLSPGRPKMIAIPDTIDWENSSLGSGVIISPDGYIVTSYHVVFFDTKKGQDNQDKHIQEVSENITITLNDGREVEGRVVALDEKQDLALLKVDEENLPYLDLANTRRLQVGDVVLAIGNARNIGQSVSLGIVSALLRRDDSYVIQTDAAINPGNSGGALIDQNGQLIGINSFIVSESGGSEGISFAVPAAEATRLLQDFLESGPPGYLGVDSSALSLDEGRERFGEEVQGFRVKSVAGNSPADKAGIRPDDVITGVNDIKITISDGANTEQAFRAIGMISNQPPGQLIVVEVYREGEFLRLPAILGVGVPQLEGELVRPEQLLTNPDN